MTWDDRTRELERLRELDPERYAAELSRVTDPDSGNSRQEWQPDLSQPELELFDAPALEADFDGDAEPRSGAALDTREQVRKPSSADPLDTLQKAARRKAYTTRISAALAEYAKIAPRRDWLPDGTLEYAYRRAIYCGDEIEELPDGSLRTRLCGARWCVRCNAVRTQRAHLKYEPCYEAREASVWFVTVSAENVKGERLRDRIDAYLLAFNRIKDRLRKTHKVSIDGIRKLECTWNPERDDFHPHYHLVLEGSRHAADLFVSEWLKEWGREASPRAQDVRAVKDRASFLELFKYFTKTTTKLSDGKGGERTVFVPAPELDTIMAAMYRKRVFQPLGSWFNATRGAPDEEEVPVEYVSMAPAPRGERVTWAWEPYVHDWVDPVTGALLVGGAVSRGLSRLLETIPRPNDRTLVPRLPEPPPRVPEDWRPPEAVVEERRRIRSRVEHEKARRDQEAEWDELREAERRGK